MNHEPLKLREQARELRRRETSAESAMWKNLRRRGFLGLKFRRQHEVGRYIVDFFCEELKLAIELDGASHFEPAVIELDAKRTRVLQQFGITVIRIENEEFLVNGGLVMERIRDIVVQLSRDPHPPLDAAPSPAGRGERPEPGFT
ncbi:MAG TPA: endonuclease domain-containing protein [Thermoanaerobaculia bacterium]|nr:endonuclease domain-containing protein [Thermoanaerobaculia bacterium]